MLHHQAIDLRLFRVLSCQHAFKVIWILFLSCNQRLFHLLDECLVLCFSDHSEPLLCVIRKHQLVRTLLTLVFLVVSTDLDLRNLDFESGLLFEAVPLRIFRFFLASFSVFSSVD
jgi:hypothetical protein